MCLPLIIIYDVTLGFESNKRFQFAAEQEHCSDKPPVESVREVSRSTYWQRVWIRYRCPSCTSYVLGPTRKAVGFCSYVNEERLPDRAGMKSRFRTLIPGGRPAMAEIPEGCRESKDRFEIAGDHHLAVGCPCRWGFVNPNSSV